MMISLWSKHVGVILIVLMCDIWINVLLQASALVGPLYIVNWNARWNSEMNSFDFRFGKHLKFWMPYMYSLPELKVGARGGPVG
jgi:hypothetical protein